MSHPVDAIVTHHFADLDEVRLHYVEAGEGPLVVLLHGFPEFWFSWRHQIGPLVEAGFRVVAPDLPGFNRSDQPRAVESYRATALAADVAQLVAALGERDAIVVGHDWGAGAAWWTATLQPDRVRRLVISNFPHPGHFPAMSVDPAQIRRSWYIALFQLPWISERIFAADDYEALARLFRRDPQRPGAFTDDDIERYREAFRRGGTASLRLYRGLRRDIRGVTRRLRPIECPTQVIWGARDSAIGLRYAPPPAKWVWDVRVDIIEDASHWVQVDRPEAYNERLLDFLR